MQHLQHPTRTFTLTNAYAHTPPPPTPLPPTLHSTWAVIGNPNRAGSVITSMEACSIIQPTTCNRLVVLPGSSLFQTIETFGTAHPGQVIPS